MPQPKPVPVPPAPTASTETPLRIFSVGQTLPSGKVADEAFLDAVVANWQAHQAKADPRFPKPPAYLIPAASVGLGHDEDQRLARAYAERSDLPAVGWPGGRLWRDGPYLMAERLDGVPAPLAAWANAGAYKKCSAEFYEDYQGLGPCLRRVSLLGADIPACKDLGDLPRFVFDPDAKLPPNPVAFTERLAAFARAHRGGFAADIGGVGLVTFSESTPAPPSKPTMTPQQQALLDALAKLGVDTSKLDGAALDSILQATQATPAAPVAANADPNAPKPGMLQCSDDEDGVKKGAKTDNPATFTEKQLKALGPLVQAAVIAGVAPVQVQLKTVETQLAGATARLAAADHAAARSQLATFCETHKDKIFPYELDAELAKAKGTATLIDQLMALPADAVATFAEGKLSPRAAALAAIAARPPVAKFAEKLAQPPIGQTDVQAQANALLQGSHLGRAVLKQQAAAAAAK